MALHLEGHPGVHATFNFVPSLLDQLDEAVAGGRECLFDLLARPVEGLSDAERATVLSRCVAAPRHALERWPRYRALCLRVERARGTGANQPTAAEVLALECWFLLAWVDPVLLKEPEAAAALASGGDFLEEHRDGLLALYQRLIARVVPGLPRAGRARPGRAVGVGLLPPDPAAAGRRALGAPRAARHRAAGRAVHRPRGRAAAARARLRAARAGLRRPARRDVAAGGQREPGGGRAGRPRRRALARHRRGRAVALDAGGRAPPRRPVPAVALPHAGGRGGALLPRPRAVRPHRLRLPPLGHRRGGRRLHRPRAPHRPRARRPRAPPGRVSSSSTARTAGRTTRPTAGRSSRRSTPRSRPRPTSAP